MPLPPRNERSPLRLLTNVADSSQRSRERSTPIKMKDSESGRQKSSKPRSSSPLPPHNPSDDNEGRLKKPRASLNKRVSFGGNSINVYYKQSEYSPPEHEPAQKAMRTDARPSPSPRRSPSFLRERSRITANDEDEDTDNTLTMPEAPTVSVEPSDSVHQSSPMAHEIASPVPLRRDSNSFHDRKSFGLFVDEDITRRNGGAIHTDNEDMTIDLPKMGSLRSPQQDSIIAGVCDGDITQPLHNLIPMLLQDEEGAENQEKSREIDDNGTFVHPDSGSNNTAKELEAPKFGEDVVQWVEGDVPDCSMESLKRNLTLSARKNEGNGTEVVETTDRGTEAETPAKSDALQDANSHLQEPLQPSPAIPIQARTIPPNRRKLFDNDPTDDDDTTLHYRDKQNASDVERLASRKDVEIPSERPLIPSTPCSAAKSKLRNALEDRPSAAAKRDAASELIELSSSAPRSSQRPQEAVEAGNGAEDSFTFLGFLQAVQLNFERKSESRHRAQSLAGPPCRGSNIDRSSPEGMILDGLKKSLILETFRTQIEILRGRIAEDEQSIETLRRMIETSRPTLFSKMSMHDSMPIHETTTCRVSMKRLRKLSMLKAKEEWVEGRMIWEKDLGAHLHSEIDSLFRDISKLKASEKDYKDSSSSFLQQISDMEMHEALEATTLGRSSSDEDIVQRRSFVQEMSIYRDVRTFVNTQTNDEEDLALRKTSIAPLRSSLLAVRSQLRQHATATTDKTMKKLITEREELNSIVSGVSGLTISRVNRNSLGLNALGMMDVQFSLHDEKVINTSCKVMTTGGGLCSPVWESYAEGAVNLVNWSGGVKATRFVRDIPSILYGTVSGLRHARIAYEDAAFFLDRHMGKILSAGMVGKDGTPSLELMVQAPFYSLRLRSKFDMTVTLVTHLDSDDSKPSRQMAKIQNIDRYFGEKPENDNIANSFEAAGSQGDGTFSLPCGLQAVWDLLK